MIPEREKVQRGLECCYNNNCGACPYSAIIKCQHKLHSDALALLREQDPRVIELSEISPDIYVWVEDRDDGTVFPLKGGVIDPDKDDYFIFDADFGEGFVYYPTGRFGKYWRVWDKCPTPEQMRDTKWEGEQ